MACAVEGSLPASEHEVVAALGEAICRRVGEPRYDLWFRSKTKLAWDDGQITVGVPNHFYQEWMQKTFAGDVRAAAAEVAGMPVAVGFVIDPELFQAARRAEAAAREGLPTNLPAHPPQSPPVEPVTVAAPAIDVAPCKAAQLRPRSRRWRRLEDFVDGACNRVAHASALSVVESPGQDANPLVLHGPVGTGKTHLLEGIYLGLRKNRPDWRICFATAEEFTSRFVQAMRLGKLGSFRKQFRDCDALLLDDAHFLATKKATQEEFLHTLDGLLVDGRQVVVSCDCHPRLADEFLPELTDRLLAGAMWGLTPPDDQTRLHLLRARVARLGQFPWPEEVLQFLADHLHGNVRELEGAVNSLFHFSRVAGKRIDLALTREALADLLRHSVRVVRLEDVDRAVCSVLRLDAGALTERQRSWKLSHPRMLAMHLARKHTAATFAEVGEHFGGRNHSTVVAAQKKVRHWLQEDSSMLLGERQLRVRDVIERVERELLR
jgi:chromosomal replication initiator protein